MMNKFLFLMISMTTLCFTSEITFKELENELEKNPKLEPMSIGVCIKEGNNTYFAYNAKKLLRPVSTLKILSTALAFKHLDHEKPFLTKLGHTGSIENDVLKGDLILKGESDPTLGSDRFGGIEKIFEELYQPLKYLSVKRVIGDIIVDASHFEKAQTPASWMYEDLANYYGAGANSLNIHENFYGLSFRLGKKIGDEARLLKVFPKVKNLKITNHVTTREKGSGDQAYIFGKEYSNDHVIRGTLPLGQSTFKIRGSLPNPPLFFLENFCDYLKSKGIKVSGKLKVDYAKKDQKVHWIYTKKSPSLKEVATLALKHSINLYSEAFLKQVGHVNDQFGSTENGLKALNRFLEELHVKNHQFSLYDASGVSIKNLITPEGFVGALEEMKVQKDFDLFLSSIAKAANYRSFADLEKSLGESVYLKTGSSNQNLCFAGYVPSESGKLISYCLLCNNCETNRSEVYLLAKKLFHIVRKI